MWNKGQFLQRAHEVVDMQAQKEEDMGPWSRKDSVRREYEMVLCPFGDEGMVAFAQPAPWSWASSSSSLFIVCLLEEHHTYIRIRNDNGHSLSI